MGCRPSKHASSKIRAAETMGGGFGSHFGSGKFSRRIRPGGFQPQVKTTTSLSHCHPSAEFSDFSTTTATYSSPGFKTSKITVRLSSDGSTLEIEKCEIEPEVVLQRSESAPILPSSPTEEQTTLSSFQQTVCADVVPLPFEFRGDHDIGVHSLPSSECHTRVLPHEPHREETIYIQAPKATLDELEDFAISLPKATLAVAEETNLSFDNGSISCDLEVPCCKDKETFSKITTISEKENAQQVFEALGDNYTDNSVSRSESTDVSSFGLELASTSSSSNKIDIKYSSTSSDTSDASGFHLKSIEKKLAFCSYSNATDETWNRRISGLSGPNDNYHYVRDYSSGDNSSLFLRDDLSNCVEKVDKGDGDSSINPDTYTVRARRLVKSDPIANLKEKCNHSTSDTSDKSARNCSAESQGLGLKTDAMTTTSANFFSSNTRQRQKDHMIKENRMGISTEIPGIDGYQSSCDGAMNTPLAEGAILEDLDGSSSFLGDEKSNGVGAMLPSHHQLTDIPPTCKESIPVAMETSLESEEGLEQDDNIRDITYVHRGFINDFEDMFDEVALDDSQATSESS